MSKKSRKEKRPEDKRAKDKNFSIMADLLPKPWELADMEKKVKVTITLNESSIKYFKKQAKKFDTPYQAMIRNLLQQYAAKANQ